MKHKQIVVYSNDTISASTLAFLIADVTMKSKCIWKVDSTAIMKYLDLDFKTYSVKILFLRFIVTAEKLEHNAALNNMLNNSMQWIP